MTLIINNWKLLLAVIAFLAWGELRYSEGEARVQHKWDEANTKAIISARETEQQNAIFSNKIGEKYEANIQNIDDTYRAALAGLHERANGNLPATVNSTSKPDATTCRNTVYQENKRLRLELARQAEINTQRLMALQEWVKGAVK